MVSLKENWKYWYHFIVDDYIDIFLTSILVAVKISFISFNCLVVFGFGVCVWWGAVILDCRTQRAVCHVRRNVL